MDIRMWSREVITDLLNLYQSYPCLWKTKSDCYKKKNLRERAYDSLVQFCQERGFPEANRDFVVKKIQSLRGSFRKELKKVEASRRRNENGEIYEPSLWYYYLLLFTKDQELTSDNLSDTEDKEECWNNETSRIKSPQKKRKKLADPVPAASLPRRTESIQSNFHSKPLTEYEAFGINVAKKMEKMDDIQAIYAESLITSVLRDGLLKKLDEDSALCKGACNGATPSDSLYVDDEPYKCENSD